MDLHRYPEMTETLQIKPINEIPRHLLEKYANELSLKKSVVPALEEASIKFGAFVNGQLVGFVCASVHKNGKILKTRPTLFASAVFVEKKFRRFGIGKIFTHKLISEAKKMGCSQAVFNNLYPRSRMLFEKEKAKIDAKKSKMLEIRMQQHGSITSAAVRIKRQV